MGEMFRALLVNQDTGIEMRSQRSLVRICPCPIAEMRSRLNRVKLGVKSAEG
jgi:hypothetical protein